MLFAENFTQSAKPQWGIFVTKWLGAQILLLFLAPLQVGCFRISQFIPDGIEIFEKILPEAELKIVTNSVYLVIQSCGFPTL